MLHLTHVTIRYSVKCLVLINHNCLKNSEKTDKHFSLVSVSPNISLFFHRTWIQLGMWVRSPAVRQRAVWEELTGWGFAFLLIGIGEKIYHSQVNKVNLFKCVPWKDGAFLVRDSSNPSSNQPYTLVVLYQEKVYNIQIRRFQNGFMLGTGMKSSEVFKLLLFLCLWL